MSELMIVLALIAVLATLAVPTFEWISGIRYRTAARDLVCVLREVKSRAIASNREHRLEFEAVNRRYRVTRGDKSVGSTDWHEVVWDWTVFPAEVTVSTNVDTIHLNTDGTASGGTITIKDGTNKTHYEVRIASTGRIRIPTIN